ncbi:MAG TPA: DUF6036 family nucleotidyltransferase [Azospirillum sp.]|nr:DUF6036 family nucleotidyltransferase [Azospirillum sp.]
MLVGLPDAPTVARTSVEIDAYVENAAEWEKANPGLEASEEINTFFGYLSQFHLTHGFHIDGVDERTACLPPGWRQRAVTRSVDAYGRTVTAIAPATNDLIVSKLHVLRDKDEDFIRACHAVRPLDRATIKRLLADTQPADTVHAAPCAFLDSLP